ncbi:MAG: chemotaxis-specific protein-glutamate methyltransferase CheB [Hyphomonadaceae bacterium]|nr:chemotaxis-specific protein-glutamate methyltransferase CheB [Hyphomonadaceae bacterium]
MEREATIGVLVVEDSAVIRGLITRGIESDPAIRVVGSAGDGLAALALLETLAPQIVLLDVEMPVMDGLAALPRILAKRPGAAVIMASALTHRHAAMSLKALQLGAADYVRKPDAGEGPAARAAFFEELKLKIKTLAGAKAKRPVEQPRARPAAPTPVSYSALAIGSSTGGPPALVKVFARARGGLKAPVFVTQHMPATFTALLAEQLGQVAGVQACEGAEGQIVQPATIYVAPGGRHMLAERSAEGVVIRLSDAPPEHFCKPAVDPMLRSLAKVYGAGLLGVVLTGMGRDGADGCIAVAEAGGRFITQDEATSVVYGMPQAAYRTGRALAQLPLEEIGGFLFNAAGRRL